MASTNSSLETIVQLNSARGLALNDASFYRQIVPGVLPIVGINATIELQRWGADFIAESLASAALASSEKQQLSLLTLQIIKDYLESPRNDETVVRSAVQAATSAYPLAFRHVYVLTLDLIYIDAVATREMQSLHLPLVCYVVCFLCS